MLCSIGLERSQHPQHRGHQRVIVERELQLVGGAARHHTHGVGQHHLDQADRGRRGVDRHLRHMLVDQRQRADMVGVGVRDKDRRQVAPVDRRQVGQAVAPAHAHASVDQHTLAGQLDIDTACANAAGAAQELYFHSYLRVTGTYASAN